MNKFQLGTSDWKIQNGNEVVEISCVQSERVNFSSTGDVSVILETETVPDNFMEFVTSIRNQNVIVTRKSSFASAENDRFKEEKKTFVNYIGCEFESKPLGIGRFKITLIRLSNKKCQE